MTNVVAMMGMRRKRLLTLFEKAGATHAEKAVSLQEIYDSWDIRGLKILRMRIINQDTDFLYKNGKLEKTSDGKYFLRKV